MYQNPSQIGECNGVMVIISDCHSGGPGLNHAIGNSLVFFWRERWNPLLLSLRSGGSCRNSRRLWSCIFQTDNLNPLLSQRMIKSPSFSSMEANGLFRKSKCFMTWTRTSSRVKRCIHLQSKFVKKTLCVWAKNLIEKELILPKSSLIYFCSYLGLVRQNIMGFKLKIQVQKFKYWLMS